MASTLLGTLLDFPTYLALPLFVAVGVGWGANWRWPFVIVALLVAYAHMVLTSQLVLTAAGGLLRSRRFRDVSIVVLSLLGSSCYFINQGVQVLFRNLDTRQLVGLRPLTYLQWLPPGATARAIERASAGDWSAALLWLLYATLLLGGVAWLWWRLLLRVVTGEGFLQAPTRASSAPVQPTPRRIGASGRHPLLRWVPDGIHQLFIKEIKAIWRFPQRRIGLIQGFLGPLFVIGAIFFSSGRPDVAVTPWWGLTVIGYAIFSMWITSLNMLGWEGKALPMLLGTPYPTPPDLSGQKWRTAVDGRHPLTTLWPHVDGWHAQLVWHRWLARCDWGQLWRRWASMPWLRSSFLHRSTWNRPAAKTHYPVAAVRRRWRIPF